MGGAALLSIFRASSIPFIKNNVSVIEFAERRLRSALSLVTLHASYSRQQNGCATLNLPDGLMVSSTRPSLRDEPKPRFSPSRGFFLAPLAVGEFNAASMQKWASMKGTNLQLAQIESFRG